MEKMETMFCVFDDLAKKASPPFFADNDDVAVRQFRQLVDPLPPFARKDFKLFRLGEMDAQTMEMFFIEDPVEIDTVRRFETEVIHE
nr:MAG: nonstructural protein [Microvirus sp.]